MAGLAAAAVTPAYHLVVTAEDGRVMWRVPVRVGTPVVLAYTNSIYRAPTEERLLVTAAGFELVEVRTTSEAVLQYNALPPPYARQGGYIAAHTHIALPPVLPMRIGQTGRQRLMVADRLVPLFASGVGTRVTVELRHMPLLATWVQWP